MKQVNANTAAITPIRKLIYMREEKKKTQNSKEWGKIPASQLGEISNLVCCITTDEKNDSSAVTLKKEKITQHWEHTSEVHPQMNTYYFSATYNKKLPLKIQV